MYGREELESHLTHINCSFFKCYLADEADKVMDAMEARIKELESDLSTMETDYEFRIKNTVNVLKDTELKLQNRIKELEADAELDQKKRLMLCEGYNKKCERVKELEAVSILETTEPKWISVRDVKNRPNEKGDYVLVCDYVNRTRGTAIYQNGKFTLTTCGIAELNITHWMPLPPPPTTEEK